ncbi:NAD-dependent epimerase/dehydratase family protein [Paenibacillus ehimensis]|uniref:NAD-dependent epimerase/dehydratase family protein n=1 Tax=Paenibacillus ehimensis TaxID=79264 RepID=UPI000FD7DED1|nr:NAD-dependent epimerase/dehydratase family protein [Paenibacillus ehimensis]MEC0208429.1 NAD-dependent epimerase/dehydratase family protein [Paenibacillus ehimensis]
MKAVVFGGSGFIGSHTAEQLVLAGHEVTAAVREQSDTAFLDRLGVNVVRVDFSDPSSLAKIIRGHEIVYNCTADAKLHTVIDTEAEVEVKLTRRLIEAAASQGAGRFVQLSTIVMYDFRTGDPIDESYVTMPEYPIQALAVKREEVVRQAGREAGIGTILLRPASTIGVRDLSSFFSRLFRAHAHDQYPIVGDGSGRVSLIDTRDIGRAMVWLGTLDRNGQADDAYLLKGFDTTWSGLKAEIDRAAGKAAATRRIPESLTEEELARLHLTPFAIKSFTVNRLWNDSKIRRQGFATRYSLTDAVDDAVRDLLRRNGNGF